jgi:amino acid permease
VCLAFLFLLGFGLAWASTGFVYVVILAASCVQLPCCVHRILLPCFCRYSRNNSCPMNTCEHLFPETCEHDILKKKL